MPYKSQVPGVMHACGHDLHTTLLLGVAKWFSNHKDEMCGNLKLLFQPNEERDGGAERMVKAGCYYRFGVSKPGAAEVYPLHNSRFELDPEALIYGTALYAQIAEDFLMRD